VSDTDIVITRQQLEAWVATIKMALTTDDGYTALSLKQSKCLHQALEDMTDELIDGDEVDIIDDADMFNPDEVSEGWTPHDDGDTEDFRPAFF